MRDAAFIAALLIAAALAGVIAARASAAAMRWALGRAMLSYW
jgi:archaellum component FlaG (FlaF/FlaG flagellin family)